MNWYKYIRFFAPNTCEISFEARLAEGGSYHIDNDLVNFAPVFEAIVSGTHTIHHIPSKKYDEWRSNPTTEIPYNDICFQKDAAIDNIRKFVEWEIDVGACKSKLVSLPMENRNAIRFIAPTLGKNDGFMPKAFAVTAEIASVFAEFLAPKSVVRFVEASAGYNIYAESQNEFSSIAYEYFSGNMGKYDMETENKINSLINGLKEALNSVNLTYVEMIIDNKKLVVTREQISNFKKISKTKDIRQTGQPHKLSFFDNSFHLKAEQDYACHFKKSSHDLMQIINNVAQRRGHLTVEGTINTVSPKTIWVNNAIEL